MKLSTRLTARLLKNSRLSIEDRVYLTNVLMDKLNIIQISDIIKIEQDGTLLVNGRQLDYEGAKSLKEGAKNLLDSQVRTFLHDEVRYRAIQSGIHKSTAIEDVFFSKAAIWWGEQENEILHLLAGE